MYCIVLYCIVLYVVMPQLGSVTYQRVCFLRILWGGVVTLTHVDPLPVVRQDVSLSTTLYIVAVSRNHQFYLVTSFTWSNLRCLTFAFVFRWRFYPRLIYVLSRCNVRYNDTFPRDVKQIGFYPKQTLTTVFQLLFRFSPLCL